VIASNNSGVWNDAGDTLSFSIAPAYYQTQWFAAMVALGIATLLWAAYQLRIRQLAHQFNRTLDARVSERTRIARDLHDTLLQSFQGALLRFSRSPMFSRRAPRRRGSGLSARWTRQKRPSPKDAMSCRACARRRRR
jgi:signal transduction histidine kinase